MNQPGSRQRLVRGAQAQAIAVANRTLIQAGTIAVLAGVWGRELFGEWLILAAIPLYLSVSDLGFFTAGSYEMIMRVARGDRQGALHLFQASTIAIGFVFGLAAVLLAVLVLAAPLTSWFNLERIDGTTAGFLVFTLGLNVLASSYATLLWGGLAAVGRSGEGVLGMAGVAFVEFGAMATAVLLGGGPEWAAGAMLLARVAATAGLYRFMRSHAPWLTLGRPPEVISLLRPLGSPAIAAGAFPIGLTLNTQGMVILIGAVLGPASVAVFSTLRTLSRLITTLLSRVFIIIAPELSMAYAEGDVARLRGLHRTGTQAALWFGVPIVALIAAFGEPLVRIWTSGEVTGHGSLLLLFLLVAALNAFWLTSLSVMYATNRHQRLAVLYITTSIVSLVAAYALLEVWGLEGAVIALVVLEAVMLAVVPRVTLPATEDTTIGWLRSALRPPNPRRLFRRANASDQPAAEASAPPAMTPD